MTTVLITGGTGLVGRHLCKRLQEKGYGVAVLSRTSRREAAIPTYTWDLGKEEIEKKAIETADCIIHLAGANIGDKRWTVRRKQLIIDSRIKTGQLIFSKIKELNKHLQTFISASAIGYYGTITSDKIFTETDPAANDFLGDTCRKWEQTADRFKESGIRTVKIRSGVVLTRQGGALSKMITPVKMGIGSAIGTGNQYLPWIHIDDLCDIYIKAIEDTQMDGAYNAVAPDHKTNKEFTRTLAHVLKKPFWFPNLPAITMKLMFGKMSEILLTGSRISADKIKATGYNFLFPDLETALTDLIKI
ncbi:MAG: epimerase [bacterium]|nr:MAG: epimerase [bacterium]